MESVRNFHLGCAEFWTRFPALWRKLCIQMSARGTSSIKAFTTFAKAARSISDAKEDAIQALSKRLTAMLEVSADVVTLRHLALSLDGRRCFLWFVIRRADAKNKVQKTTGEISHISVLVFCHAGSMK